MVVILFDYVLIDVICVVEYVEVFLGLWFILEVVGIVVR